MSMPLCRMFGYTIERGAGTAATELLAGPHTDRTALRRLQRCIVTESGGDEDILAYDKNGEEMWLSAHAKAFRNARGKVKYMVAFLTDITESRQLWSLQQLIMTALADEIPITEIADRLCRRVEQIAPDVVSSLLHIDAEGLVHPLGGPSLPDDYSRALDGVAIGPDVGSCGSAAYLRRGGARDGYRHRSALAALQEAAAGGRLARLLVLADQGQGWPRDRNLRVLFQGMPRALALASAHRRRLRSSRRARHRAQGSARPDRAACLLRHVDRPAQSGALAASDLRSDRGLSRRQERRAGLPRHRQFQGRQRFARAFGRRRDAGRICPAAAHADPAGRRAGPSWRRRIRDRAAGPRRRGSLAGGFADHRGADHAAQDRQPGWCRCPPAWASASIRTTRPTSIR